MWSTLTTHVGSSGSRRTKTISRLLKLLALPCTLKDLGIEVSTGRVVDFRSRDALLTEPIPAAYPLIYPGNLRDGSFMWPSENIRKVQCRPGRRERHGSACSGGLVLCCKTVLRERGATAIVASAWSPLEIPGPVAFENHLNVFHVKGTGLDEETARGLTIWLNSTLVDRFFRIFSGHTQVNATDLRSMRFPARDALCQLGRHTGALPSQAEIDQLVSSAISHAQRAA